MRIPSKNSSTNSLNSDIVKLVKLCYEDEEFPCNTWKKDVLSICKENKEKARMRKRL